MTDLLNETRIYLTDLPKVLRAGPDSRPTHISTCVRWINKGIKGVKLEAVRLGGRWVTSREAVTRFAARLTAISQAPTTLPATREHPCAGPHVAEELAQLGA